MTGKEIEMNVKVVPSKRNGVQVYCIVRLTKVLGTTILEWVDTFESFALASRKANLLQHAVEEVA
jgi:hypothetical protein